MKLDTLLATASMPVWRSFPALMACYHEFPLAVLCQVVCTACLLLTYCSPVMQVSLNGIAFDQEGHGVLLMVSGERLTFALSACQVTGPGPVALAFLHMEKCMHVLIQPVLVVPVQVASVTAWQALRVTSTASD